MPKKYGKKVMRKYKPKQSLQRMVKSVVLKSSELKFIDNSLIGQNMSGTLNFARLTSLTGGTGDQGVRIGDKIHLKNIQYSFILNNTGTPVFTRVSIIQWNDDDTFNPPTSAQLFQDAANVNSYFNKDSLTQRKFHILMDKERTLVNNDSTAKIQYKGVLTPKNRVIGYNGASANGRGNIYVLFWSDQAVAPLPQMRYDIRVTYKDI